MPWKKSRISEHNLQVEKAPNTRLHPIPPLFKSPASNLEILFVGISEKPAEGVSAKVLRSAIRVHARDTIYSGADETCQVSAKVLHSVPASMRVS